MKKNITTRMTMLDQVPDGGVCQVECGCILKYNGSYFEDLQPCKYGHDYQNPECVTQRWGLHYCNSEYRAKRDEARRKELCQLRYKTWDFYWEDQFETITDLCWSTAFQTWLDKIGAENYWDLESKTLTDGLSAYEKVDNEGDAIWFNSVLIQEKGTLKKYRRIELVVEHNSIKQELGFLL